MRGQSPLSYLLLSSPFPSAIVSQVVVKDVGESFDPFTFALLRFSVAAAAFSPFLSTALKDRTILRAGCELGVFMAAGYLAQSQGLASTDASRASFLSTFTVLVVPFLAGLSGSRVRPVTWAAAALSLVGVGLLEQSGRPPSVGDIWSFVSAVAFGIQVEKGGLGGWGGVEEEERAGVRMDVSCSDGWPGGECSVNFNSISAALHAVCCGCVVACLGLPPCLTLCAPFSGHTPPFLPTSAIARFSAPSTGPVAWAPTPASLSCRSC